MTKIDDLMAEIRDANLNYLMLAQQMIRADKACAIYRLGISLEIANLLENLSNAQILKLASAQLSWPASVLMTRPSLAC